ncbi:hypothetical protein BHM03_00017676 [Ensete ventricosum]|nr:hypothetical protein BHM03_00017676 [Ensete ventricosum]
MRSYYVFIAKAARKSGGQPRPAPKQGRPPMARPRPRPPTRGRSAAASDAHKGRQPAGAAACIDGACGQKRCPRAQSLVVQRPQGWSIIGRPQGATAHGKQGLRRRRQGWLPLGRAATGGQRQPPPTQGQRRHRGGKRARASF